MASSTDKFLAALNQRLGKKAVKARRASEGRPRGEVTHFIPTSLTVLNRHILGGGGFPCRRMTEVVAPEGVGKSSLIYDTIAHAQKLGFLTALIETENRLNRKRVESFGVNMADLILEEPGHLEGVLERGEALLEAAASGDTPMLLAWDSFAATPTRAEVEEGLVGKAAVADRARMMSRCCRVLSEKVARSNTALVIVNQLRTDIKQHIGDNQKSVGGNALQYYATTRLRFMGGQPIKKGSYRIGIAPILTTHKNLEVDPFRKARCFFVYKDGWSDERTLLEFGKDHGILPEGARISEEAIERVKEIGDLADWDPIEIGNVLQAMEKKPAAKKPAAKKATKKTAKKPAAKKATKKTAKKTTKKG